MKLIYSEGKLDMIAVANVCGIYGWKFPDGKWLVGYSSNMVKRLPGYFTQENNKKFRDGLLKYGWIKIEGYILEECPNEVETLLKKEGEWSINLNSVEGGYNVVECGQQCSRHGSTQYDDTFKSTVSKSMKRWHAERKSRGNVLYKSKYTVLILNKILEDQSFSFPRPNENMPANDRCPLTIHWNTSMVGERKRLVGKYEQVKNYLGSRVP